MSTSHADVTQGRITANIRKLAIPNLVTQLLFMAPGLYDAIWLGRLGSSAQAAAGIATSVRVTMISVLMALSGGSGAVVARYVGAKDQENANRTVLQAIYLMLFASGTLGLIGFIFIEPLMRLGGADADVLPLAIRYGRILFLGLIAMEMVPSMIGMLSSAGAPQIGLVMNLIKMITLVVTEPLFVKWWGLEGAVISLVSSNVTGMLIGLGVLVSGRAPVRIDLRDLRLDFPIMGRIIKIAMPAVIQRGSPNLLMSILLRIVAGYGEATLAAFVVVRRIFSFALIPAMGLSHVAPAMVGQNLGAKRPKRAEKAVGIIARQVAISTIIVFALLVIFAPAVMIWFTDDPAMVASSLNVIKVLAIGYFMYALSLVYDSAQVGAGDTVSPMLINVLVAWLVQLPLAYGLPRLMNNSANALWFSLVISWTVLVLLLYIRYRQGKWKLTRI